MRDIFREEDIHERSSMHSRGGTDRLQDTNTERLQRLIQSARVLQAEIDNITREIQYSSECKEKKDQARGENENADLQDPPLEVGQRIQYSRRSGKRLNPHNGNNGRGAVTKITAKWIF